MQLHKRPADIMNWIKRFFGGRGSDSPGGDGPEPMPDKLACHEALERVYEYLDGELPEAQDAKVAEHFRMCERCYPHLEFERTFIRAVQGVEDPLSASDDLRARVLEVLRNEGMELP